MQTVYRDIAVTITTPERYVIVGGSHYTPLVKIALPTAATITMIMTSETFATTAEAESRGMRMAEKWIDKHLTER